MEEIRKEIRHVDAESRSKEGSPLLEMQYPGRAIIGGTELSGENNFMAYILTGRSDSSQARELYFEKEKDAIGIRSTDKEATSKGNEEYLLYDKAIIRKNDGSLISANGKHIFLIDNEFGNTKTSEQILEDAFREDTELTSYEKDPLSTPRIGAITKDDELSTVVIREGEKGNREVDIHTRNLRLGLATIVATYQGDVNSPRSFGKPKEWIMPNYRPKGLTERIWEDLKPSLGDKDVRVSVASMFSQMNDPAIRNMNGDNYD